MNIPNKLLLLLESLNYHKNSFTYNESKANFISKPIESRYSIEYSNIQFDISLDYERLDKFHIEGKANLLINFEFEKVFKCVEFRKFFLDNLSEQEFQQKIINNLCNNIDQSAFKKFDSDSWELLHEQADNFQFSFLVYDKILKTKKMQTIKWNNLFYL